MIARRVLLGLALIAQTLLIERAISRTFSTINVSRYEPAALVMFALALFLLARTEWPRRVLAAGIVGFSVLLEALALTKRPVDSDDDFRYMWDAKVQLRGIDPYRYSPSSPQLAHLRDPYLFNSDACARHPFPGGCTEINLPLVHTIYPPVAEGMFTLIRLLSFGGHGHHFPLQLAAALGVLAVTLLLLRRAWTADRPLWPVAIWAWCPITMIELVNNAHIDWLGVLLAVSALMVAVRGKYAWAGVLLGAAFTTKLYPILVGAGLLKRRPFVVIGSAIATTVAVYLLHVLAVGQHVLGFLPSYLNNGGYGSGKQYRLLSFWLPASAQTPVAIVLVVAVLLYAVVRSDPDRPERSALIAVGGAVIVVTPTLPWYTLLLLALAAMNARPEWLGIVAAPTIEYLFVARGDDLDTLLRWGYLVGLAVLVAGTLLRRHYERGRLAPVTAATSPRRTSDMTRPAGP